MPALHCDSCEILLINSHACHETGCPDAWRTRTIECKWCGQPFTPRDAANARQGLCSHDCSESYYS